MINWSLLLVNHLSLIISLICVIFIICLKNDFKHVIKEFVFFMSLSNFWTRLDVWVFVNAIWSNTFNDVFWKHYERFTIFSGPIFEVTECSLRNLNITWNEVSWNARLEFEEVTLTTWKYRIFGFIKELTRIAANLFNFWDLARKTCTWRPDCRT